MAEKRLRVGEHSRVHQWRDNTSGEVVLEDMRWGI